MIPCPWLTEVAEYAKSHPNADLGLHLTLTERVENLPLGTGRIQGPVPSLSIPRVTSFDAAPFLQSIKADEVEREIRAQIERAIAMGIHPTHLDSHMGMLFLRPDYFAATSRSLTNTSCHFWLPSIRRHRQR